MDTNLRIPTTGGKRFFDRDEYLKGCSAAQPVAGYVRK